MLQFLVTDRKAERIGGNHVIMLPGSEGVFQQFDDCLCSLTVPGKDDRTPCVIMCHVVVERLHDIPMGNRVSAFRFLMGNHPRFHCNLAVIRSIETAIFPEESMGQAYGTVHLASLLRIVDVHVVINLAVRIPPVPNAGRDDVENIGLCQRIIWRIEPHRTVRIIRLGRQIVVRIRL